MLCALCGTYMVQLSGNVNSVTVFYDMCFKLSCSH